MPKRKRQDNKDVNPPTLPRCAPTSSDRPAAALSINQILHSHWREPLFVAPLYWTSRHLDLLQCSFGKPVPTTLTSEYKSTSESDEAYTTEYMTSCKMILREHYLRRILAGFDSPLDSSDDAFFLFDQHLHRRLECVMIFHRPDPEVQTDPVTRELPVAACFDLDRPAHDRRRALHPGFHPRRGLDIATAVSRLKMKKITPAEPLHDPYLAALLIAVAQRQRAGTYEDEDVGSYASRVLVTSANEEHLYLYASVVSDAFLDKLSYPGVPPAGSSSIRIHITTIPYKPYETFRNRVYAHILPPQLESEDAPGTEDGGVQH